MSDKTLCLTGYNPFQVSWCGFKIRQWQWDIISYHFRQGKNPYEIPLEPDKKILWTCFYSVGNEIETDWKTGIL